MQHGAQHKPRTGPVYTLQPAVCPALLTNSVNHNDHVTLSAAEQPLNRTSKHGRHNWQAWLTNSSSGSMCMQHDGLQVD
jgi:hypothetical protein